MYSLAKSHANKMAKEGRMYHSNRYALKGGECCLCSRGKPSARTIVSTWMASKAGHAEWLMDSRVRKAAVGIGQSRHGTYVAWSFSGGSAVVHYLSKRLRGLLR
jgi:uncharacterized protein YkwD